MTDVARLSKKAFTWSVVSATILWSMGAAALIPLVAQAAECPSLSAGAVVKVANNSAVYLINTDLKRMYFPTGEIYKSWFKDFSAVQTITPVCLENYPTFLGNGVNYRPGSRLVKSVVTPSVYAIGPNNMRHKIASEAVAKDLYGANWASLVRDVADVFMGNLADGTELASAKPHNGMLVKKSSSADVYFVKDGKLVKVDGALSTVASADVRTVSDAVFASVEMASGTATAGSVVENPSQKAAGSTTTVPTAGGSLSVSLAGNTPAAALIPNSTAFNNVLAVTLSAGSADVSVTGLKVKKSGFAANSAVAGVSVFDAAGVQHGNTVGSLTNDGEANLLFSASPIIVKANTSQTVWIKLHTGSATSGDLKFSLEGVTSNASSATGLPVAGNSFTLTSGANSVFAATVNAVSDQTKSVSLGATEQEAFNLKVTVTNSNEDVLVEEIMLYNSGTASDSDVANIALYNQVGDKVATGELKDRYVTLKPSKAMKIAKGGNHTFRVKVDIKSGSSRNVRLNLQEDDDIKLRGASTGAYVLPTLGTSSPADTSFPLGDGANLLTIASGSLSVSESGTPTANLASGESDAVLGRFVLKATGEPMELRKLKLLIVQGSGMLLDGTVYVKVDGQIVYSVTGSSLSTSTVDNFASNVSSASAITMSTYYTLPADKDAVVEIVGSVDSDATTSESYGAGIDVTEVKLINTNSITDPASAAVKSTVRSVSAAALTATNINFHAGTYNVIKGTAQATMAKFTLNANSSGEDVRVNSLVFAPTNGAGAAVTDWTNLSIYEDGVAGAYETSNNTATFSSTSSVTFTFKQPLVVKKGTVRTFYLKGNLSSGASSTSNTWLWTLSASSDIVGVNTSAAADTIAGTAQTSTVAASGTMSVTASYQSGHSYNENTRVAIGATEEQFTVFKFHANDEDVRVTDMTLTATGTLAYTDFQNIKLFKNDETSAFATAAQFSGASSADKTYTFSNSNGLFVVPAGQDVFIRVKTDISGAGGASLSNTLRFNIESASDVTGKGVVTGTTVNPTAAATISYYKQISPASVVIAAVSPTEGSTQTQVVSEGTIIGQFRVQNNGSTVITLGTTTLNDSGTSSASTTYDIFQSSANGTAPTGSALTTSSKSSGAITFAASGMNSVEIQPGEYRTLTVKVGAGLPGWSFSSGSTFQLYVSAVGDVVYRVRETDLGYDGNTDGSVTSAYVSGLFVTGKPQLGRLIKS